jgi:hypothetical protein
VWQLVLQRRQLKEQQLIVAQQVLVERRDVYTQFLAALREWDAEQLATADLFIQGGSANFYSAGVEPKRRAVLELLPKVQLIGSLAVVGLAVRAVTARVNFLPSDPENVDRRGLEAKSRDLSQTRNELLQAMRAELSVDLADANHRP